MLGSAHNPVSPGGGTGTAGTAGTAGTRRPGWGPSPSGSPPRSPGRLRRPRLLWCGGFILVGAGLFWCYLRQSQTTPVNSDGSAMALQAWDMLHGNLLLHGWILSDVSFYPTELAEYMLVDAVHGLGADSVHISAALTYTLLVLLAALVARGQARGREGLVRAVLAGGIMIAPGFNPGTRVLILSPDHTGTGVPILLTLLLMDRLRARWYVPVAVCALLTATQMADPLGTYAAAAPLLLVSLVRACPEIVRGKRPPASRWYDASLAVAAVVSAGLAHAGLSAIHAAGGFLVHPPAGGTALAPASMLPLHARTLAEDAAILFGANFFGQPSGIGAAWGLLHLAGAALALWGLGAALRGFFTRTDRVSQVVATGTLITLAAGLLGTYMTGINGTHEIAIVLPFGAVLAGRMLGGRLARARLEPLLGAGLACYLASLAWCVSQPVQPPENQDLTAWLTAHHLQYGLAGYWQADSVSLDSGGRIRLAPVVGGGGLAYPWETDYTWYDPPSSYANFVVSVSGPGPEINFSTPVVARRVFGPPAHTYHFGRYAIMVWNKNLLYQIGQPAR